MRFLPLFISAVIGYLIGSINSSVVIGKLYKTDVRTHGSGNAGLTNTFRVLGRKAALFVLLGDVLKGIIACLIGLAITKDGIIVAGTFAVVGHNWPVYFNFKGGKGILTSAVVVLMLDWRIGLIALGIFIILVALTKYVSLGSIIASLSVPVSAIIFNKGTLFIIFAFFLAAMAIYRHRTNIKRLADGTENKLSLSKKG